MIYKIFKLYIILNVINLKINIYNKNKFIIIKDCNVII